MSAEGEGPFKRAQARALGCGLDEMEQRVKESLHPPLPPRPLGVMDGAAPLSCIALSPLWYHFSSPSSECAQPLC